MKSFLISFYIIFSSSILFGQIKVSDRLINQIDGFKDCSTLYPMYTIGSAGFFQDINPTIDTLNLNLKIIKYIDDRLNLTQEQLAQLTKEKNLKIKILLKPRTTSGYPIIINSPDIKTTKDIQEAVKQFISNNPRGKLFDSIFIYSANKCDYYKYIVKKLFNEGITISDINVITNRNDFFSIVKSFLETKEEHFNYPLKVKSSYLMTNDTINTSLLVPDYIQAIDVNSLEDLHIKKIINGFSISYRPTNVDIATVFGLYISDTDIEFLFIKFNSFINTEIKISTTKIASNDLKDYMKNLKYNR